LIAATAAKPPSPERLDEERREAIDREQSVIGHAAALRQENMKKANTAFYEASSKLDASRIVNFRMAKQALDQVRRHAAAASEAEVDALEKLERKLRHLALDIIDRGGVKAQIAGVGEGPAGYVPPEVKVAVWARDGGVCVRCDTSNSLRFNPVSNNAYGEEAGCEDVELVCTPCAIKLTKSRAR
jgi:hypothetical protein